MLPKIIVNKYNLNLNGYTVEFAYLEHHIKVTSA